jgi:hypothetical protein
MLPDIKQEGIVLIDEGISGSIRKWSWITGSLVLTGKRFAAFTFYPGFNPIINVQLDDERLKKLHCSLKGSRTLCILFDPSYFRESWSGSIECRFKTPKARLFLEQLKIKTS